MEQTVYGDILFFVNFCMDFQCLFLTAKLLRRPFYLWRSVLFAALGALYACAALFLQVSGIFAFLADCGVCLLMCVGAFYTVGTGLRTVLPPFFVYFGVSFAVGGVMSGMAALLSHIELPMGTGGGDLSAGAFFALALLGGGATFLWGRFCQRKAKGKKVILRLLLEGVTLSLTGLVDTGNLLRDPVGGRPVALVAREALARILPSALSPEAGTDALSRMPPQWARRVRLIPTETATGKGMLLAILPDAAFLDAGRGEHGVELLIAPVTLSSDMEDYQALLPAVLITE